MRAPLSSFETCIFAALIIVGLVGTRAAFAQVEPKLEIVPRIGHSDGLTSVAISIDGNHIATGSYDNTVKLWDVATGSLIRTFAHILPLSPGQKRAPESSTVLAVAFTPDGERIVSGSENWSLNLWNARTGTLLRSFSGHTDAVSAVALTADGSKVFSGSWDTTIRMWDVSTGAALRTYTGHSQPIRTVALSADGRRLASGGSDNTVALWDVESGSLLRSFKGHLKPVRTVAFTPNGKYLVSGSSDKTVKIWDIETGTAHRSLDGHNEFVTSVLVTLDGRLVSASEDSTIKIWDWASGTLLKTLSGHSEAIAAMTLSSNGTWLVTGGEDNRIIVWEAATGSRQQTLEGAARIVRSVAATRDGDRIVSGGADDTIRMWDGTTGALTFTLPDHAVSLALSADGNRLAVGSPDKSINLWDLGTKVKTASLTGHVGLVRSVAMSADTKRIVSGSWDKTVKLWDTESGAVLRTFEGHAQVVSSVAITPEARLIVSGSRDKSVKLWDADSGALLRTFEGHAAYVRTVAITPDGSRIVSGSNDKTLKVWDAVTGNLLLTLAGHAESVSVVTLYANGSLIVSGSEDATIKVWDTATGTLLRTITGHGGAVSSVVVTADAKRIVSGSWDGNVKVWTAGRSSWPRSGELLVTMIGGRASSDHWLTMTPKGFFAAGRHGGEILSLARGFEVISVAQVYHLLHRPDLVEEMLKGDPDEKHRDARVNLQKIYDSGPPPQLEYLPWRTERTNDSFKFTIRLTDIGGGIGSEVWWRVNGKTRGDVTIKEVTGPTSPTEYAMMTHELRLDLDHPNIIEVIAFSGNGLRASLPLKLPSVDKLGLTTEERPRLHVLTIGVDNYALNNMQLNYAKRDAYTFGEALRTISAGSLFLAENVEVTHLLDSDATATRINAEFERLALKIHPRDVFVAFVAGHGRSRGGSGWYFLPADYKPGDDGIGMEKWRAWLRSLHVDKSLLVLDSCEAAAGVTRRGSTREQEAVIAQLQHASGHPILYAAPDGKAAFEHTKLRHGVMTYAILEAMHRAEGGDPAPVTILSLAQYVGSRVPQISDLLFQERQKPKFEFVGEDFPLGFRSDKLGFVRVSNDDLKKRD